VLKGSPGPLRVKGNGGQLADPAKSNDQLIVNQPGRGCGRRAGFTHPDKPVDRFDNVDY